MIMRIPILKSILRNLDWFEEARRHHVAPDGSILLGGTNHRLKKAGDWEESKHPRADNGQFGSGSGGSSKPKKPTKTRRKMERREEAASQARVGGAIQSLLSGGSALDKIGWFKQPEKPKVEEKPEMKSYTLEEYRKYIYPISLEDLMTIDDPKEFGRRLAEECGILYNLA